MKQDTLDACAREMHTIVHQLVKKYQFRDRNKICCHNITVSQCYIMYELQHGALSMRELAGKLDLDISTMSRVVSQLQKKNYVLRENAAFDKRVILVSLTDSGSALFRRIESSLLASEREILQKIPASTRQSVLYVLRELLQSVTAWRDECCVPGAGASQDNAGTCR